MSGTRPVHVSRGQVLAHRVAVHGFDRSSPDPGVLALGAQDTPYGSARLALAARGASPDGLELVWSFRGAPHLHRRGGLPALAAALWPVDDADATARIDTAVIREGARLGVAAFRVTAEAFREVVTAPMSKGEVSTAVSAAVPESLTYWCERCGAQHISGLLFQQAGLFGAIGVVPEGAGTVLAPLAEGFPVPAEASGTSELVRAYLRFLGPAGPAEVAKFLGTRPAGVRAVWPDDLAEVSLEGRRAWLPAAGLDALLSARSRGLVRLLPPGDPYLQARDRTLLVPDKGREKEIWRAVGGPGALLVGSEIAGTWRARAAGRKVDLTVTPFGRLSSAVREQVEAEAATVASARGAVEARLHIA
ncbi:DNA glycosylase AlkZ-like family protein [Streptomyces sp. CB03234]|uniref:DNA glycosylase AlkZ-like family protein n=1 Tax=Streptomyces sp. (strain CB03234) TaxID=1703937 RepID=UPI00093BBFD1|nr:crosslink repair DNA glycosylase YcaQ family protein [Streptomyces sp. CB03234]